MSSRLLLLTFQVERWQNNVWSTVTHTLEFKTSSYRGVILGRSWKTHSPTTQDVWAGDSPEDRRFALSPILGLGGAGALGAIANADNSLSAMQSGDSDSLKYRRALDTWMDPGWALLRLPPGRYRITKVATHVGKDGDGPEFVVAPGVVNYVSANPNPERANQVLRRAIGRLPDVAPTWEIAAAAKPEVTPVAAPGESTSPGRFRVEGVIRFLVIAPPRSPSVAPRVRHLAADSGLVTYGAIAR